MDLRMAVLALAIDRVDGLRVAGVGRMSAQRAVARLAEPRPRNLEHEVVGRAVGVVTVRAVLPHRGVLEQERSALFGVALVAGVIGGRLLEQRIAEASMRVMAAAAGHLSFAHRHVRGAPDLGALVLVALGAGVDLYRSLEVRLPRDRKSTRLNS